MALRLMGFWRSGRRHNGCMNPSPQVAKEFGTSAVFDIDEERNEEEGDEVIYAMPFPSLDAR